MSGWSESVTPRRHINVTDSNPTLLGSSVDQHDEPLAEHNRSAAILSIEAAWSAAIAWSLDATQKIDDLVYEAIARCGGRSRLTDDDETECWNRFSRIYGRLKEQATSKHVKEVAGDRFSDHPNIADEDGYRRTTNDFTPARPTAPSNGFAALRAILHPDCDTLR